MNRRDRSPTSWGMRIIDALADLVLGSTCPGCDLGSWGICARCTSSLDVSVHIASRFTGLTIVAANAYRPVLEHAIPRYKDDGALHLEPVLAARLARAVAGLNPPEGSVLVPVPSRPSAVRARGFDHGARLSATAAHQIGLTSRRLLRRKDRGKDQQGLGLSERKHNVASTMRAAGRVAAPVVLVDDIVTTGASLQEAAKALASAGITVLGAAVIASAEH